MKEITQHWLNSANDDLKIIDIIIDESSLTHQVAFHAQQAIEKSFKAVVEEKELQFLKTHSLTVLYSKLKNIININFDASLFTLLDDLYLDSRYPGDLGLLPDGKPTNNEAKIFYDFARDINAAISNMLNE